MVLLFIKGVAGGRPLVVPRRNTMLITINRTIVKNLWKKGELKVVDFYNQWVSLPNHAATISLQDRDFSSMTGFAELYENGDITLQVGVGEWYKLSFISESQRNEWKEVYFRAVINVRS